MMTEALNTLVVALLVAGSFFAVVGGIGLNRFPDFFSRIHAVGVTDTLGAGLILLGLGIYSGFSLVTVKLVTVWLFIYLTGPAATHALGKAAYSRGHRAKEDKEGVRRHVIPA